MLYSVLRNRQSFLNTAVLAVFMFSLVLQPVFALLGESHEHSGHTVAMADMGPNADSDAVSTDMAGQSDFGSALHALLHAVHCCGSMVAYSAMDVPMPSFERVAVIPEAAGLSAEPSSCVSTPFRPPISG